MSTNGSFDDGFDDGFEVDMALEVMPTLYTSRSEMASIFSDLGVGTRLDDDSDMIEGTADTENLDSVMMEATDFVNMYLGQVYTVASLVDSRPVRRWASAIACYYLSLRRGNSANFQGEYDRIESLFMKIRDGRLRVPRLKPQSNFQPGVQNYTLDYRYTHTKQRIDPLTETGGSEGDMYIDQWPLTDWYP